MRRPDEPPTFVAPDAYAGPPAPSAYSRWKKTSVSYGPVGRIAATILFCAVPIWWGLSYSIILAIMWVFFVGPLLLRSIWKKTRLPG